MSAPIIAAGGTISGTDNCITDGKRTIVYDRLLPEFSKLDALLGGAGNIHTGCICFPFNNTVNHIIILLYLLERKISFFIASPNLLNREVPRFCDKILNMETGREGQAWDEIIDLVNNPGSSSGSAFMIPDRGIVVFASSGRTGSPKFI